MFNFLVRKLDPSTARVASDPGSVPELSDIEAVLAKAFKTGESIGSTTAKFKLDAPQMSSSQS
jgi:hypothetical protein